MSWIDEATTQMQRWFQPTPLRPSYGVAAGSPSIEDDATLPFHPSDLSLRQDPEKTLNAREVTAIARARRLAESQGVLTPELGEYLLPMAMTEGEGGGIGIIEGNERFYASKRFKSYLDKMGMKEGEDYTKVTHKGEPHFKIDSANPAMAAVILGEKSRLRQAGGTVEGAIKGYNGRGKALERGANAQGVDIEIPADVELYLKKVQKAKELLEHPKNSSIYNHFNGEYGRLRSYLAPGK